MANLSLMTSGLQQLNLQQQGASFLHLPGEIRNKIYSLVLVRKGCILLRRDDTRYKSTWSATEPAPFMLSPGHPPLLLACRTINQEARSIYYQENTFAFTEHVVYPGAVQAFRRLAGSGNLNVTSVKVFREFRHIYRGILRFSFTAMLSGGGIEVRMGRESFPYRWWDIRTHLDNAKHKICNCELLGLVATHSHATRQSLLLDFLEAYAGTVILKRQDEEIPLCKRCGKFKCI